MVVMATPWKHPKTGVYYIRRSVPGDLRDKLGHEYKRTLETKDPKEAKRRFIEASAVFERLLAAHREKLSLSQREAKNLAGEWLASALESERRQREHHSWVSRYDEAADVSDSDLVLETMERLAEDVSDRRRREHVAQLAADVLRRAGLPAESTSDSFERLSDELFEAKQRLHSTLRQWDRGDWRDHGALDGYPVERKDAQRLRPPSAVTGGSGPSLRTLFEEWKAERKPTAKTISEYERAVRRFEELHGTAAAASIDRASMRAFKAALVEVPAFVPRNLRAMPLPNLLAAKPGGPKLSAGSINKHLSALQTVLQWAYKQGWFDDLFGWSNPVNGLSIENTSGEVEDNRQDYSLADLQMIFSSPVFRNGARPRGGCGEAAKWLPLLGVFTGARLAEIAGLRVCDVEQHQDISYIAIRPHAGRRLKNKKSCRDVVLHPQLLKLGFIEYVEELRRSGEEFLFPEIATSAVGQVGASWSKWWRRYCNSIGLTDRTKVFHSFRHTFKTAARSAGIPEDVHDAITGHTSGTVGRTYGEHPLAVQARELRRLTFPQVNFDGPSSGLQKGISSSRS